MIPYNFLSVLVMPTDYCNMNCVYCFNSRKTHQKKKVMTIASLRQLFQITIPYYREIKFIWHGGEPLSMGLDFYKKVIELQKEININGAKIGNSIQSNLTLLDDEYVKFFLANGFKVGGSFDGTQNELTRHNTEKILAGRELMVKNGGRVGFICVVQSKNIDCLIKDYEWFKKKGINYTLNQYMAMPPYDDDELYVSPEHYAKRICEFFDYWANDALCNISITYFEDFVDHILFGAKKLCCYNSCLGKHIGVQYNGDIYNCNRDFSKEYSYGNINDYVDIHQCFDSPGFERMLTRAINRRNHCKENCDIYDFCTGGCNSTAYMGGDMEKGNAYVCQTTRSIYKYIEKQLAEIMSGFDKTKVKLNPFLISKISKHQDARRMV
ncbi:MAG: radical SAM protein [Clostridia bacterium]|nr:radical SAM protein [Clostridia bacterium]